MSGVKIIGKNNEVVIVEIKSGFFGGGTWVDIDPEKSKQQFEELRKAILEAEKTEIKEDC